MTRWWLPIGVVIGLASLTLGTTASAAPTHIRFDRLSVQEGLSQTSVFHAFQDSRGYIWLATEDGLNRFDGYNFRIYRHDERDPGSLPADLVWKVVEDQEGDIWVATEGGGIARWSWEQDTFTTYRNEVGNNRSIASNATRALVIDGDGRVWVGFLDAGLDRLDPATGDVLHLKMSPDAPNGLPSNDVRALALDHDGNVLAGTGAGLVRVVPSTAQTSRVGLAASEIRSLLALPDGRLLVGTAAQGLFVMDKDSGRVRHFQHSDAPTSVASNEVLAILHRSDETVWVGTSEGLDLFDSDRGQFEHYRHDAGDPGSLPDNYVMTLLEDRGGVVWVGTRSGGAAKWDPATWNFGHIAAVSEGEHGLSSPLVTSFAREASGVLWVGTFGGGLNRFDPNGEVVVYRATGLPGALSGDRVMSLLLDKRGRLWVGTYRGGLDRLDPGATTFVHYGSSDDERTVSTTRIMSLHEDRGGRIWVGTYGGGLNRYVPESDDFVRYPLSLVGPNVTVFEDDLSDGLWVGTEGDGLLHLLGGGQVEIYVHDSAIETSLPNDSLTALHVSQEGQLWVGTLEGGLARLDLRNTRPGFTRFGEEHGLTNDAIWGIQPDDQGALWLSTNNGLFRFDVALERFAAFGPEHGLQGPEFNVGAHYRGADGKLYFGGTQGFNAFNPVDVKPRGFAPTVVLTSFLKLNKPVALGRSLDSTRAVDLGYRDSVVTFEVAALDYSSPLKNQYRYRLEGFDADWIDIGTERRITYTNLDAGRYVLHVQAAGSDGVWNTDGLALAVDVEAPPWKRWWAYLTYAGLLCCAGVAAERERRRRRGREIAYRQQLELEVARRTQELDERATQLQDLNGQLSEASLTDPLTGLRNRRFLFEHLGPELRSVTEDLARGGNRGLPQHGGAIFLLVDLDNFKKINDTHGHLVGDEVLLHVTSRLKHISRSTDLIIRWGGDELLLVRWDSDPTGGAAMAERMRQVLCRTPLRTTAGLTLSVTCTLGFACFPFLPDNPGVGTWEDILGLADAALYVSKRSSRNSWAGCIAVPGATAEVFRIVHESPDRLEASGLVEFLRSAPVATVESEDSPHSDISSRGRSDITNASLSLK